MSVDINVHLDGGRMPSPHEWQAAITELGFPLVMDTEFDARAFGGFLPCTYKGDPAGFEYYYVVLDSDALLELEIPLDLTTQITFTTHSDFTELASSAIASAVLAKISDGLLVDTEEGRVLDGREALTWAMQITSEADDELARPAEARPVRRKKPWWRFW